MPALILMVVVSLGIVTAWVVGEVTARPLLRRCAAVGFLVIAVLAGVGAGSLHLFNYNAWYGAATKLLIDESITQIEAGNLERVTVSWKGLREEYAPTYENRARYDELVKAAVAAMKNPTVPKP